MDLHISSAIERTDAQVLSDGVNAQIVFLIGLIDQKEHGQVHEFRRLSLAVELVQHRFHFLHSTLICAVDDENDRVALAIILLPDLAQHSLASDVPKYELRAALLNPGQVQSNCWWDARLAHELLPFMLLDLFKN